MELKQNGVKVRNRLLRDLLLISPFIAHYHKFVGFKHCTTQDMTATVSSRSQNALKLVSFGLISLCGDSLTSTHNFSKIINKLLNRC